MRKEKEKKQPEGITDEFLDTVASASELDLKSMIVRFQQQKYESEVYLKTNEKILEVTEELKLLKQPCKDTVKVLNNRIQAVLTTLQERGAVL